MKKQSIQIGILLVVLGGLIAWYFGYEKNIRVTQEAASDKNKQLVSFSKDEVDSITIEKAGSSSIQLKKVGSEWSLTSPISDSADNALVANLVGTLTSTKYEDIVETSAAKLDTYGLDKPSLKLTVKRTGKPNEVAEEIVEFGSDTPIANGVYYKASHSPGSVFRVALYAKTSLDKQPKDLRNHSILSVPRNDVAEIEILTNKGSTLLTKDEKEQWKLPRESLPADTAEAGRLLSTLVDTKATDFADETLGLSKLGLSSPAIKIWLTLKDKTKKTVIVGTAGGKYFAKRDDKTTIYELSKDFYDKINVSSESLRSKDLSSVNRFDVKKIAITNSLSKSSLELVRVDNRWEIPSEPTYAIDDSKVDSYLTSIQDTKIHKYLAKGKLTQPAVSIRLFSKKDGNDVELESLSLAKPQGGVSSVERKGLDYLLSIKESDYSRLSSGKEFFKKVEEKSKDKSSTEKNMTSERPATKS